MRVTGFVLFLVALWLFGLAFLFLAYREQPRELAKVLPHLLRQQGRRSRSQNALKVKVVFLGAISLIAGLVVALISVSLMAR